MLYPIKALKKYKTADIKNCEPVVTLSSIQMPMMDESSVVYVGTQSDIQQEMPMPVMQEYRLGIDVD